MSLKTKKIHELRAIAQSMGIKFNFGMTKDAIIQEIELKQIAIAPEPPLPAPVIVTEGTKQEAIRATLQELVSRGLRIEFPTQDTWRIYRGEREDSGHISAPMHAIVSSALGVM